MTESSMSPPAANAQWLFDHGREQWVYGYLVPVGDLHDGAVSARIEYVTPPVSATPAAASADECE